MNRATKNKFYDDICYLLTDYENPDSVPNYEVIDWENEMYKMLGAICNNFEELTGEDE